MKRNTDNWYSKGNKELTLLYFLEVTSSKLQLPSRACHRFLRQAVKCQIRSLQNYLNIYYHLYEEMMAILNTIAVIIHQDYCYK